MKKRLFLIVLLFLMFCGCSQHRCINNGKINLYLEAPGAESVVFVSSLDSFKPHLMHRTPEGTWMISLPASREFRYFYLVDGEACCPTCKYRETDDFGACNFIFIPEM